MLISLILRSTSIFFFVHVLFLTRSVLHTAVVNDFYSEWDFLLSFSKYLILKY